MLFLLLFYIKNTCILDFYFLKNTFLLTKRSMYFFKKKILSELQVPLKATLIQTFTEN